MAQYIYTTFIDLLILYVTNYIAYTYVNLKTLIHPVSLCTVRITFGLNKKSLYWISCFPFGKHLWMPLADPNNKHIMELYTYINLRKFTSLENTW
jgi:hypothetical protein